MAIFKCKICGGSLEIDSAQSVATCEYCGTKQTLPKLDNERRANLYDRANHFRRNNDFDKAMGIYESILNEDNADAEAYWSIVLCRYGIEYVEDPATHKRVPTINRAQFTSIFDDEDYKAAIAIADASQREIYEAEASAINEIQKGILAISQREEPFDVFVCYKETDASGRRTMDSVLGTELYHELTREGFKVFFSRITLEDKLGVAYEPYIFAALHSAKVMVVLGTRPEHFNSVWVKNEWSRYLALIKTGAKKTLIPAYRDMDPYDLPEEFSHLQAQDMSKLGFMQDLTRGVKKITEAETPKTTAKETIVATAAAINVAPLLKRAFMFLEDGDFDRADEFCEQVLNQDPENAQAYLGKLMVELHVKRQADLANCAEPFDSNKNYQKAVRFADSSLSSELNGYIATIKDRNERKAEEARKESIYLKAMDDYKALEIARLQDAINAFTSLGEYKDSVEYVRYCHVKIEQIRTKKERERVALEQLAEERRQQDKLRSRRKKKSIISIITILLACVAVFIILNSPQKRYNRAIVLFNNQEYLAAANVFFDILDYEDSNEYYVRCYREYYQNENLIVASTKEMPYLSVSNGSVKRKENKTVPSQLIIPDLLDGEYIYKISENAFMECSSVEYVHLSSSINIIEKNAFRWCRNLKEIKLNDGLTKIGSEAFSFTAIDSIYIPASVCNIGSPFLAGTEINSIEVDSANVYYCSSGDCLIDISKKTVIAGCKNSIIPSDGSVETIGASSFNFSKGLVQITIPEGIKIIDCFAFSGSSDLTEISLPESLEIIADYSFYLCEQLTTINYAGSRNQWVEITKERYWDGIKKDSDTGTVARCKCLIYCTDVTITN